MDKNQGIPQKQFLVFSIRKYKNFTDNKRKIEMELLFKAALG